MAGGRRGPRRRRGGRVRRAAGSAAAARGGTPGRRRPSRRPGGRDRGARRSTARSVRVCPVPGTFTAAAQPLDPSVAGDVLGARKRWAELGGMLMRRPRGKRGVARLVTHAGRSMTLAAWAREPGCSPLAYRLDVTPLEIAPAPRAPRRDRRAAHAACMGAPAKVDRKARTNKPYSCPPRAHGRRPPGVRMGVPILSSTPPCGRPTCTASAMPRDPRDGTLVPSAAGLAGPAGRRKTAPRQPGSTCLPAQRKTAVIPDLLKQRTAPHPAAFEGAPSPPPAALDRPAEPLWRDLRPLATRRDP